MLASLSRERRMPLSLRRWKPGNLLLGWVVYWAGVVAVKLSPAIAASWRATRLPDGHGNITAGFNNSTLSYTVAQDGVNTFAASTSLTTALLWLAGPPLLLWLMWLIVRERPAVARSIDGVAEPGALPQGAAPAAEWHQRDRVGLEPERVRTPQP